MNCLSIKWLSTNNYSEREIVFRTWIRTLIDHSIGFDASSHSSLIGGFWRRAEFPTTFSTWPQNRFTNQPKRNQSHICSTLKGCSTVLHPEKEKEEETALEDLIENVGNIYAWVLIMFNRLLPEYWSIENLWSDKPTKTVDDDDDDNKME